MVRWQNTFLDYHEIMTTRPTESCEVTYDWDRDEVEVTFVHSDSYFAETAPGLQVFRCRKTGEVVGARLTGIQKRRDESMEGLDGLGV